MRGQVRTSTDHMLLYGAPLLLASIMVAASHDLSRGHINPGGAYTLLYGTVVGSMLVSAGLVVTCLVRDRSAPVAGTWLARAAQASSRLSLALAVSLAGCAWWLSLP